MKQIIKFRAWDIKASKMYNCKDNLLIDFNGKVCLNGSQSFKCVRGYELILMRYTGLKDMNDKNIFEGDILGKSSKDDKRIKDIVIHGIVKFGEVRYVPMCHDGIGFQEDEDSARNYMGFYLKMECCPKEPIAPTNYYERLEESIQKNKIIVLGNIHQNKNLLNNKIKI